MPRAPRRPSTANRNRRLSCEHCTKEFRSDTLARHQRTCKKNPENDAQVEQRGKNKPSQNFFITWQKHVKEIAEQLNEMEEIKGFIICNELGAGQHDTEHSHAVIIMKEEFKMTFSRFKSWWENYELPEYQDIQACKNIRQSVKYCSKEDFECHVKNIDNDYLSTVKLAWNYAQKVDKLNPLSYPYCRLIPAEQRKFKEFFEEFIYRQKLERSHNALKDCELFPWQRKALEQLKIQDDRTVFWLYDEILPTEIRQNILKFLVKLTVEQLSSVVLQWKEYLTFYVVRNRLKSTFENITVILQNGFDSKKQTYAKVCYDQNRLQCVVVSEKD